MATSPFALIGLGLALGLRHGIDWDHIAAITDITGSVVTTEQTDTVGIGGGRVKHTHRNGDTGIFGDRRREARDGMLLATLYALGHGLVVVLLGMLAIWLGQVLPQWVDPIMERVVGVTLLVLGGWIFYSIVRYGDSFRLQSRWMVIFSLLGRGWRKVKSTGRGEEIVHVHEVTQYGAKTAFSIGMIHGIGAETGSQALLLAGAAGATSAAVGSVMLLSFVAGMVASNSLIAAFSTFGFVSARAKHTVYLVIGVFAGLFSLVVGAFFVTGRGSSLPDLQSMLSAVLGALPGTRH
ncbi:MAG: hypothetical protein NVS2B7_35320 [Herpetosiphon sp.]